MVNALIIDDEKHCVENLQWQLGQYCPEIRVLDTCDRGDKALEQIRTLRPRLIFLDVEMPGMSGFEMLEKLQEIEFDIIFTTAFDQYAIRAIKFGALDFLVKPVDKDELRAAVDRHLRRSQAGNKKQMDALFSHKAGAREDLSFQKIAFPSLHGYELVPLGSIVLCEGSSNYTKVYLESGQQLLVSRTLKDIEELLNMQPFIRVHHSYLVNLRFATRYLKGEGGQLVLTGDISIPVSRNRKDALLKLITNLSL